MDTRKSSASGAGVRGEAGEATEEHFCACYEGVVYIGIMVEDSEAGEEVEVIEGVPCRRCNA